jgi:hypothetical protein
MSDGEIRFKTSIDVEGGTLTDKMIENLLAANCVVVNKYLAGLRSVITGTAPAAAIATIEGK